MAAQVPISLSARLLTTGLAAVFTAEVPAPLTKTIPNGRAAAVRLASAPSIATPSTVRIPSTSALTKKTPRRTPEQLYLLRVNALPTSRADSVNSAPTRKLFQLSTKSLPTITKSTVATRNIVGIIRFDFIFRAVIGYRQGGLSCRPALNAPLAPYFSRRLRVVCFLVVSQPISFLA